MFSGETSRRSERFEESQGRYARPRSISGDRSVGCMLGIGHELAHFDGVTSSQKHASVDDRDACLYWSEQGGPCADVAEATVMFAVTGSKAIAL
jgi:hypothetical protein